MADDPQGFRQVPDTRLIWQDGIGPVLSLHPGVPQEQRELFVALLNKGGHADRQAEALDEVWWDCAAGKDGLSQPAMRPGPNTMAKVRAARAAYRGAFDG